MKIPEDSPAGLYLAAMRRSRDNSLSLAERKKAHNEANRFAFAFGYEKTRELDALLLLEDDES